MPRYSPEVTVALADCMDDLRRWPYGVAHTRGNHFWPSFWPSFWAIIFGSSAIMCGFGHSALKSVSDTTLCSDRCVKSSPVSRESLPGIGRPERKTKGVWFEPPPPPPPPVQNRNRRLKRWSCAKSRFGFCPPPPPGLQQILPSPTHNHTISERVNCDAAFGMLLGICSACCFREPCFSCFRKPCVTRAKWLSRPRCRSPLTELPEFVQSVPFGRLPADQEKAVSCRLLQRRHQTRPLSNRY